MECAIIFIEKNKEEAIVEMENIDYEIVRQNLREGVCPECGNKMQFTSGCALCVCCGYSKCQ
jgi:hypothetical protein